MKLIGSYVNGNYKVEIYDDGTKVRMTEDDNFIPSFAENCDVKITDRCDGGCLYCYEGCTPQGRHAELLKAKWVDTLHPFTELAINGNDLSHPQFIPFLEKLREKHIIANMTVNQKHFMEHLDYIDELVNFKLIHGLGVSLSNTPTQEFIEAIKKYPNAVIHVINGIFTSDDYQRLKNNGLKLLILGYKNIRRGHDYLEAKKSLIDFNQRWLYDALNNIVKDFAVVSFDNLALDQLEVKRLLSDKEWEQFYMGDDGGFTFYIDMVAQTFAKNSLSLERFPMMDTVDEMFAFIQEKYNK